MSGCKQRLAGLAIYGWDFGGDVVDYVVDWAGDMIGYCSCDFGCRSGLRLLSYSALTQILINAVTRKLFLHNYFPTNL